MKRCRHRWRELSQEPRVAWEQGNLFSMSCSSARLYVCDSCRGLKLEGVWLKTRVGDLVVARRWVTFFRRVAGSWEFYFRRREVRKRGVVALLRSE